MKGNYRIVFFSDCVLMACSKVGGNTDGEDLNAIDQSDNVFPVITVTKPTAMQVYISGDSILAEDKVTAPANYSAYIEFGDHGGNTIDTTVEVKVNP